MLYSADFVVDFQEAISEFPFFDTNPAPVRKNNYDQNILQIGKDRKNAKIT